MAVNKVNYPTIKFFKYWLPVVIYAGFIFYLSSIPGEDIPPLFAFQDVVFHIIEYAIFALLVNRALEAYSPQLDNPRRFAWVILIILLYAISDEFHQAFVPNRYPQAIDLAYDCLGAFVANIFYRWLK